MNKTYNLVLDNLQIFKTLVGNKKKPLYFSIALLLISSILEIIILFLIIPFVEILQLDNITANNYSTDLFIKTLNIFFVIDNINDLIIISCIFIIVIFCRIID